MNINIFLENSVTIKLNFYQIAKPDISYKLRHNATTFMLLLSTIIIKLNKRSVLRILVGFVLLLPLTLTQADPNYIDNGDGTVTHIPTGFMWKRCVEGQVWAGGTCVGAGAGYYGVDALKLTSNFAGYNDWTVPTIYELRSSLPYDDTLFPNQPSPLPVWSSSIGITNEWLKGVQFGNPSRESVDYIFPGQSYSKAYAVRFVRGSKLNSTKNTNGTTTQYQTGLMWQTCLLGQTQIWNGATSTSTCSGNATTFYKWANGVQAAQSGVFKINFAGYNDWRLPKIDELQIMGFNSPLFLDESAYGDPNSLLNNKDWLNYVGGIIVNNYEVVLVRNLTSENAIYDDSNGTLTIQDVQIGTAHYQITLREPILGNYTFSLSTAQTLTTPASITPVKYATSSNILSVPRVKAFGGVYNITLINQGDNMFRLSTSVPIAQ